MYDKPKSLLGNYQADFYIEGGIGYDYRINEKRTIILAIAQEIRLLNFSEYVLVFVFRVYQLLPQ
ncbi:hypothetical protein B5G50_02860 [Brevibacillus brevis]|nr:hypothetical protein B5G50_02860 [Brevibacillus brevis]